MLQLQIKARRTKTATDVVYQVLWPKERKGESFLLRRTEDSAPSDQVMVICEKSGVTLTPISGWDTFGLDSLGLLGIVAELEKRHGMGLPERMEHCKTPADFLAAVNGVLTKGA